MVNQRPGQRRARGFTIIELMTVLVIMAVLAAIGMPAMKSLVAGQHLRAASSELFSALQRTRSEAIKRNSEVALRPAVDTNWASGWIIPDPSNSDDKAAIERHAAVPGAAISGPVHVIYLGSGRIKGSSAPEFEFAVDGATGKRCITVDLSGRPAQTRKAC